MGSERETEPIVVDDWPERVPVTQAELNVIETRLGHLLDDILTPYSKQRRREPTPDDPPNPFPSPTERTSP
ncbi:hypothetical protein ABIE41_000410 [Bosea sp. OAE506]